jgi:SAM-dependent methyltransferase
VPAEFTDHFAAFPQEWPRRFILGWSPSGICVECGEGRRPVTEVTLEGGTPFAGRDYRRLANGPTGGVERPMPGGSNTATITGYACACPNTDAPTRPAVVLDPFCGTGTVPMVARALGRHGIGVDLSADYLKLARWRISESGHALKSVERTNRERQGVMPV